jgi:hypothetical protein
VSEPAAETPDPDGPAMRNDGVAYIYAGKDDDGWYWQSRDSAHQVIETQGGFKSELKAAQAGADRHPSQGIHAVQVRMGHDPTHGED